MKSTITNEREKMSNEKSTKFPIITNENEKTYKVIGFISIETSLLKLSKNEISQEQQMKQIHKVVLQDENRLAIVAYFMDGISFGQNSTIIVRAKDFPLVFNNEYKVVEYCSVADENLLLIKMIEKLKNEHKIQ